MSRVVVKAALSLGFPLGLLLAGTSALAQSDGIMYKCPDKVYTNQISAKQAKDKGCAPLEGSPITVIAGPKRGTASPSGSTGSAPTPNRPEARVDPSEQRARDTDARRILELELRKEEESLASLKKEYNNGEPERRGDERNYQKYLDRVAELKANLARKETDVASLKRELGKLQ